MNKYDKDKPMSAEEALKRIEDARDFLAIGQRVSEPYLGPALEIALAALREKQECEYPEPLSFESLPLTIEQLQEMIGQPIWFQSKIGRRTICGVLGEKRISEFVKRMVVGFPYGWEWLSDVLRSYDAYAHKPSGEETT